MRAEERSTSSVLGALQRYNRNAQLALDEKVRTCHAMGGECETLWGSSNHDA